MAVLKHLAIKKRDYGDIQRYLLFKCEEGTHKPVRDDTGRMVPRDFFIQDGINCNPFSFDAECAELNRHFHKNRRKGEIMAHHYIISFDPRDAMENGLTPQRAHDLSKEFAEYFFAGYQALIVTHADGNNGSGNIHTHIIINSLRKDKVEWRPFMENNRDCLAGYKHHLTDKLLHRMHERLYEICVREHLYNVEINQPADRKITDREYHAQQRGQREKDRINARIRADGYEPIHPNFETVKQQIRDAIDKTAAEARDEAEFKDILTQKYKLSVRMKRGRYMTRYKLRKIGANTMVGYRSYLTNHLYPAFGDLPIDSITVDRVQDFMLLEADNGSAKASINRIMQLLTQIMDSAVEDELIIKNPCKSKRLYNPSEKQQKVLPYTPGIYKQMERLLPLLPTDTDKLYLGLSMYAGLRQGEIVALRWEDVDFDLGFIHVRRAIQYAAKNVGTIKPPKTDNGVRDIPMMGQLRAILEALRKDEGFIICGQRGADKDLPMTQQMVRNMDIRVNKFFAEHGIEEPFKSHRMRHTVLTLLNNSRLADDKSLQAWAGHRDAAFTRRQYMTPQEEQLQTVGNGFSEYISSLL